MSLATGAFSSLHPFFPELPPTIPVAVINVFFQGPTSPDTHAHAYTQAHPAAGSVFDLARGALFSSSGGTVP